MRRALFLIAATAAAGIALAPAVAFARAGSGSSVGSRGSFTYSAPPVTRTAPSPAAPFQRSVTPPLGPTAPASPLAPGVGATGRGGFGQRSPFMSGLFGGLIGAGIGGLLFGGGLFGGIDGFGGFLGFLLQIFLLVMLGRFLLRLFLRPPSFRPASFAGAPGLARDAPPMPGAQPGPARGTVPPAGPEFGRVAITDADFKEFQRLLGAIQAAWSNHDLSALRQSATPEMVGYLAEQMADQASKGVHNVVGDVRLEQGDLAEAWSERGREYATVAMRFSMIDVTYDASGRVVDGSETERVTATEVWTFLRRPGGRWVLSAIQQVG